MRLSLSALRNFSDKAIALGIARNFDEIRFAMKSMPLPTGDRHQSLTNTCPLRGVPAAAIHSQANTAKLLVENPALMRELEILEKIASAGHLKVTLSDLPMDRITISNAVFPINLAAI